MQTLVDIWMNYMWGISSTALSKQDCRWGSTMKGFVLMSLTICFVFSKLSWRTVAKMSIGVPIKVLHEAEGHIVTCETNTGEVYRGKLIEAEDNMNCQVCMEFVLLPQICNFFKLVFSWWQHTLLAMESTLKITGKKIWFW